MLFTRPKWAIYYFCITDSSAIGSKHSQTGQEERGHCLEVEDPEHFEIIAKIKEQWIHNQSQQEEIQKVLANKAAKHEIINWLKHSGWIAHFLKRDLSEIYLCNWMPSPEDNALWRLIATINWMFFDRCIGGLLSMPLIARLLLASPYLKDAYSRPFGPLQEKTSMDRYLIYWKRFLCYCLNILSLDKATLLEMHRFSFPSS